MKGTIKRISEAKAALTSEAKDFSLLTADEKNMFNRAVLHWTAPLYENKHKPRWWYFAAAAILVVLGIYGFMTGAWTMLMALVLFVGFYYYFNQQEVPEVEIVISEVGIKVGKKVYPYSMFRTFWLDYNPPVTKELHLIPNNNYKYELTLHLNGEDPVVIKTQLAKHLPEWADRQKSITESLVHLIGL